MAQNIRLACQRNLCMTGHLYEKLQSDSRSHLGPTLRSFGRLHRYLSLSHRHLRTHQQAERRRMRQ